MGLRLFTARYLKKSFIYTLVTKKCQVGTQHNFMGWQHVANKVIAKQLEGIANSIGVHKIKLRHKAIGIKITRKGANPKLLTDKKTKV